MADQIGVRETLHANIFEIERGLFSVRYRNGKVALDKLPLYQLGTSSSDAKNRIETVIREYGYDSIEWDDPIVDPLI